MDTQTIYDRLTELDCEKVKIVGNDVMCCCPFHPEREPSFGVHPDHGANCFACGVKFHDAEKLFEVLCNKRGVEYVPPHRNLGANFDFFPLEEPDPDPLNPNVLKFYKRDDELFKAPDPEGWSVTQEVIERRRLCVDPTTGSQCFPIFDEFGNYWGMVERSVVGGVRYYSYPPNYPRRNILFGEDQAVDFDGQIWVVEGVRDLCYIESRFPEVRAVALGTARITDEQVTTLATYEDVVLCLDNDKTGYKGRDFLLQRLPPTNLKVARYKGKDPLKVKGDFEVEVASLYWMRLA